MATSLIQKKSVRLFVILSGFFIANAIIAEFIGVKIFSLEKTLGLDLANLSMFGNSNLNFNLTVGVLLWPVVFVMTDIINEYFGQKGVRLLSYLAVFLISYAFLMIYLGINLVPPDFWPTSHISSLPVDQQDVIRDKVSDFDYAYKLVFGQGLWIIVGSITAFLIGQILDVWVFHNIKKATGEKMVWLRATGSTLFSQFFDSYIVLVIAFYIGANWDLTMVLAIGTVGYIYKVTMAILLTPVIYLAHYLIDNYLGEELSTKLKEEAARD